MADPIDPWFTRERWLYGRRVRLTVVRQPGPGGRGPKFHVIACRRAGYDPRRKGATFVAHLLTFTCRTPADEPDGRRMARACVERPHRITLIRNRDCPGVGCSDFRPGLGSYAQELAKVRRYGPRLLWAGGPPTRCRGAAV